MICFTIIYSMDKTLHFLDPATKFAYEMLKFQ